MKSKVDINTVILSVSIILAALGLGSVIWQVFYDLATVLFLQGGCR